MKLNALLSAAFTASLHVPVMVVASGIALAEPGKLIRRISKPTPAAGDQFGVSVAAVRGHLCLSANRDSTSGAPQAGAVYVFHGASGNPRLTIPNPQPNVLDRFRQPYGESGRRHRRLGSLG